MKIVKVLGGLGNQMFQYAFYLALKEKFYDEILLLDKSCFKGYPLHNGYELERIFHINCEYATWKELIRVTYPYPNYRWWQIGKYILPKRKTMLMEPKNMDLSLSILDADGDLFYDGYWQHEEYFINVRDKILQAFSFPPFSYDQNLKVWSVEQNSNSVSVHIRRGDYLNHPYYKGICGIDYYKKAIDFMLKRVHPENFIVFSNDTTWCRSNLSEMFYGIPVIYVDWNKGSDSYRDLQLMTGCKHHVIANSSFSWWGAWLNKNEDKIVVAPQKWMNMGNAVDPICNSWVRV